MRGSPKLTGAAEFPSAGLGSILMTAIEREHKAWTAGPLAVEDLGRIAYRDAYEIQLERVARQLEARESGEGPVGTVLLLEHDPPVITVSRRPDARKHLVATPELLERHGVTVAETDRGGDITYHGPGQLVAYPIIDLKRVGGAAGLGLHEYMRLLERAVIATCAAFGVRAHRDVCATGVWVGGDEERTGAACADGETNAGGIGAGVGGGSKICAMGVRVKRWVTMHGLALNVSTNLEHFRLIVPCGLAGRAVTSLERELGESRPSMDEVKARLAGELAGEIGA